MTVNLFRPSYCQIYCRDVPFLSCKLPFIDRLIIRLSYSYNDFIKTPLPRKISVNLELSSV